MSRRTSARRAPQPPLPNALTTHRAGYRPPRSRLPDARRRPPRLGLPFSIAPRRITGYGVASTADNTPVRPGRISTPGRAGQPTSSGETMNRESEHQTASRTVVVDTLECPQCHAPAAAEWSAQLDCGGRTITHVKVGASTSTGSCCRRTAYRSAPLRSRSRGHGSGQLGRVRSSSARPAPFEVEWASQSVSAVSVTSSPSDNGVSRAVRWGGHERRPRTPTPAGQALRSAARRR